MLQDAEYSTHANINRAGMQPYRYETFTAAAAGKVHRFCGIKKTQKNAAFAKGHTREDASPRQQRLDIHEVAGAESNTTHANDQHG